jgi:serine/threonine protein kinase
MLTNICCVVVEYLPGCALKSFLIKNRRRKLAFKVVVQIALDLARGLVFYWIVRSTVSCLINIVCIDFEIFIRLSYLHSKKIEIYCCDMPYLDLSFSEVTSAVVHHVKICFVPFHMSC